MAARPHSKALSALFLKSEVASGTTVFGNQANLADFLDVHRSQEYGSTIIHSVVTGRPSVVYGNMPNRGAITNLS